MRIPGLFLAALVGAIAFTTAARAQTQGIIGTDFESTAPGLECSGVNVCRIFFLPTPASKIVKVTSASCRVKTTSAIEFANFGPFQTSGPGISSIPIKLSNLEISAFSTSAPFKHSVKLVTPLFIGGGRFPGITVLMAAAGTITFSDCVLSGTVISG